MADWLKPTITSDYLLFVDEVKNRDYDAISLQYNAIVNPPFAAVKLVRSPIKFQQWIGSGWGELTLSVEGGGTGATTVAGIRTNLGLGTMAYQNANAITVTGGTIQNITSGGAYFNHQGGTVTISRPTVAGHTLAVVTPINGSIGIYVVGDPGANGVHIYSGNTQNDSPFRIMNYNASLEIMRVTSEGSVWIPVKMAIPVGVDKWITW